MLKPFWPFEVVGYLVSVNTFFILVEFEYSKLIFSSTN